MDLLEYKISRKESLVLRYKERLSNTLETVLCLNFYDIPSSFGWISALKDQGLMVRRLNSNLLARAVSKSFGGRLGSSLVFIVCKLEGVEFKEIYGRILEILQKSLEVGFDVVFLACKGVIYDGVFVRKLVNNLQIEEKMLVGLHILCIKFLNFYKKILVSPFVMCQKLVGNGEGIFECSVQ